METGQEKFANTEPYTPENDNVEQLNNVDKLARDAGLNMSEEEELGLKDKLEERDDSRLDLNPNRSLSESTTEPTEP